MSDMRDDVSEVELESGFSDQEKQEVREYIDEVSSQNRLPAEEAAFDRKSARPGLLMPAIVNGAAVIVVLVGILILRTTFQREEAGVQNAAIEYSSIEGRLIRELRAESQAQILAKEREIETVREQLRQLETEREALDSDIESRLAAREAELRAELEAEIEAERARLIEEGLGNEEIDRLMQEFEAEREAFYEQQLASFQDELEQERLALEEQINNLRSEYQSRLTELEEQRQEILEEFQEREDDLRVQLEQRTQVLEVARQAATTDLEAAQRELAELAREQENTEAIQNQIIGQIEAVQAAIVDGDSQIALARIDSLTAFLNEDQVLEIEALSRRRETDLFLLRQLRTLVFADTEVVDADRSITQELRLIGQIRRLSDQAQGAPDLDVARQTFEVLLETLPEVSVAHQQVVELEREEAVQEIRETEREIVETGTASASTLAAAGEYQAALDLYVSALDQLPSTAPDSDRIVSDILRLGYAMTDYVIYGESEAEAREIAGRTTVSLDEQRRAYLDRERTIEAAFDRERAGLDLRISRLQDEIDQLETDLSVARNETPDEIPGIELVPEAEYAALVQERRDLQDQNSELGDQILDARNDLLALQISEERLETQLAQTESERSALEDQRNRLVQEYEDYRAAQEAALGRDDIFEAVLARESFLESDAVTELMPRLQLLFQEQFDLRDADATAVELDSTELREILGDLAVTPDSGRRALLQDEYDAAADDDGPLADVISDLADILGINLQL